MFGKAWFFEKQFLDEFRWIYNLVFKDSNNLPQLFSFNLTPFNGFDPGEVPTQDICIAPSSSNLCCPWLWSLSPQGIGESVKVYAGVWNMDPMRMESYKSPKDRLFLQFGNWGTTGNPLRKFPKNSPQTIHKQVRDHSKHPSKSTSNDVSHELFIHSTMVDDVPRRASPRFVHLPPVSAATPHHGAAVVRPRGDAWFLTVGNILEGLDLWKNWIKMEHPQ